MSYKPEAVVPPFLVKTYELVSDPSTDSIIRWCDDGKAFEIVCEERMVALLAANFKHNKMASFVRQLNVYDFHKVKSACGSLKFTNDYFQMGQPHLLKLLSRKDTQRKEQRPLLTHPISDDVHMLVGELKAAREEDFHTLTCLRSQQEEMQKTVDLVVQQNRKLVEEIALSRREAVEMQRTLQIIMSILEDESQTRAPAPVCVDPAFLAMFLNNDDSDGQPPCKKQKLSPSLLSPKSCDSVGVGLFDGIISVDQYL